MKKLIALALSSAMIALPSVANAQDWHHGRDGDHHRSYDRGGRHDIRYGGYGYRNYGYARPRIRTVVSVGVPYGGYYGGYGYPGYAYGYPAYAPGYAYPGYAYGYGYPAYNYGYAYPGYGYPGYAPYGYRCGNPAAGAVAGGLAGAVIGSAVSDNRGIHHTRYGYRYRGGNGAAGAIIGGVLGAAVGGAVASDSCY
jgi:hypothetical protein